MKHKTQIALFSLIFILGINLFAQNENTITISGQVTDFNGNPIDNSAIILMHKNFNPAHITFSDETGHYTMEGVEKGQYIGLFAMRLNEYPRALEMFGIETVPEDDMRLEFWAWNVIADKDLTINPRYHRLELYGFQVFEILGGSPYLMAYVRPMSLGKILLHEKDVYSNKEEAENVIDVSVELKDIEFKIYVGNEPLTIHSVQPLVEYHGEKEQPMTAFFLQFDRPKEFSNTDYLIFRIEATHNAFGVEKGENLYFYELKKYK
ncbi:MAG: carboxypeptidase-like regulatory domain-containing protein [Bacteroidales bacterium]|nr:carboxypeptidase-like regulatory domain-containing protein [Bacteroidales bacterium]